MPRVAGVTVGMRGEMARFQADMREGVGIVNRSVNQIKGTLGTLNTFIGASMGAAALKGTVGEIVKVGDAYNQLLGRLKNATAATGDFNRVYQQLYQISQRNGIALEDSVSTFQGLARAAGELGKSSAQVIRLTDIVQKLGVAAGASPEAMKNGMTQFQQSMAGGIVRAEEWNSIVENMPSVAAAAAQSMGKSFGELRQMVVKGKLSSEQLFDALMKAGAEADKQFANMPKTVAQAQAKLTNSFGKMVHDLDDVTGATKSVAAGMASIADVIEQNSPKIVQWGRTLSAFMGVLKGEWDNQAISQEMQSLGFSYEQQVKYLEARRRKLENDALYANYDFGRGPGESGIPDVFGPNRPAAKPPAKIDQKALDELEKERKKVAEILSERMKERRELELKLKGFDDLRVKYEEEVAYIKSTTLSNKEKQAALKQLADQYEVINQKSKFLKKQEEQKDAIKNAKELLEKAKQAREELEMELGNRAKLTKYLELEVQLKKLLAQGNKGSAEAKKLQDDIQKEMEQVKQDEAAVKAKEAYDKIADSTSTYNENMESITKNLQIQNDDLQLRLQGEEKNAQFIKARQEIEQKTNEVLQKKYETLKQIQAIEAEAPNNAQVAAQRAKLEQDITNAMAQRDQAIKSVEESKQAHERLNKQLEQQQEILKDIIDSKGKYRDKVNALKDAMERGYITAEQYDKALKQIGKTTKESTHLAADLSKGITSAFEKMIFNGGKATDVMKQFGKEIAQLAARRLLLDPLQRKLESLFNTIGGGGTRVPMAPPGYGPLYGGNGLAGGGVGPLAQLPGYGFPYGGPSQVTQYQNNPISSFFGGLWNGLTGRSSAPVGGAGIGGAIGGGFSPNLGGPSASMLGGLLGGGFSPNLGGMMNVTPQNNGRGWIGNNLSGIPFMGLPLGDWMEQFGIGGAGWANGGAFRSPIGAGVGLLGSLIGKLPFFAEGGFLGAGQWGIAGERGPELIYGGNSGMSIMPGMSRGVMGGWQAPWYQQNVYSGGRGGYSGNGMISQLDNSEMLAGLYRDKYESGVRAFQNGDPNAPSWYTLREIEYAAQRHANIAANGGYTGQLYSRSQFESSSAWAEANEASFMWGGQRNDPRRYLNPALWGEYDPSQRMHAQSFGLLSGGMGQMSQGGNIGYDLPPGMREASFSVGNGDRPIISTGAGGVITAWKPNAIGGFSGFNINSASTAFNNPYNSGDLRSAHDLGSYLAPLLRSGHNDHFAMANIGNQPGMTPFYLDRFKQMTSGANGGNQIYPNVFEWLNGYKPRSGNLMGWNKEGIMRGLDRSWQSSTFDSNNYPRLQTKLAPDMMSGLGPLFNSSDFPKLQTKLAPDMVPGVLTGAGSHTTFADLFAGQNYRYGGATQQYAYPLMADILDNMPRGAAGIEAALNAAAGGYQMVNQAMPWWTSTSGAAMHFAQMGMNGITDKTSLYSQMGTIMSQPWANKSMPFASYPAAMKLFGYAKGGKYKKDRPMVVGEEGMEIVLPETAGSVVSNSQIKQAMGGGVPQIKIINQTTGEIGSAQATVDINGIVNLVLSAVAQNIRKGGDVSVAIQDRVRGIV